MFIVGMANSGRVMVGFLYASEFMTPKWQVIFGTGFGFIECATGMIIILYFDFVNKHYMYIAGVAGVACSISWILVLTFADESPLWLLKMGRIDQAKTIIQKMMRINGVDASIEIHKLDTLCKSSSDFKNSMIQA